MTEMTTMSEMQVRTQELNAEAAKLQAELDLAKEKARLINPFSWAVYGFALLYCLGVFILITKAAAAEFTIDTAVLTVLAGSTAVAVIGLVSVILTGLFKTG